MLMDQTPASAYRANAREAPPAAPLEAGRFLILHGLVPADDLAMACGAWELHEHTGNALLAECRRKAHQSLREMTRRPCLRDQLESAEQIVAWLDEASIHDVWRVIQPRRGPTWWRRALRWFSDKP